MLPDLPLAGLEVEVLRLHCKLLAAVLHPAHDHLHGSPARGLETNARVAESWKGYPVWAILVEEIIGQVVNDNCLTSNYLYSLETIKKVYTLHPYIRTCEVINKVAFPKLFVVKMLPEHVAAPSIHNGALVGAIMSTQPCA